MATLEYLKENGYMLDYTPSKRAKATAIENAIAKFLDANPDIKEKLFTSEEGKENHAADNLFYHPAFNYSNELRDYLQIIFNKM